MAVGKLVVGRDIVGNLEKGGSGALTVPSVARLKMQFGAQMPDKLASHCVVGPRNSPAGAGFVAPFLVV